MKRSVIFYIINSVDKPNFLSSIWPGSSPVSRRSVVRTSASVPVSPLINITSFLVI